LSYYDYWLIQASLEQYLLGVLALEPEASLLACRMPRWQLKHQQVKTPVLRQFLGGQVAVSAVMMWHKKFIQ